MLKRPVAQPHTQLRKRHKSENVTVNAKRTGNGSSRGRGTRTKNSSINIAHTTAKGRKSLLQKQAAAATIVIEPQVITCGRCQHRFLHDIALQLHRNKRPRCDLYIPSSSALNQDVTPERDSIRASLSSTEYIANANEIISIKLIQASNEIFHEFGSFHPAYTHQYFDEEEVLGYRKLSFNYYFLVDSLFGYVHLDFEEQISDNADDVFGTLTSKLQPGGYTTDIEEFQSHLDDPFIPPGNKIFEYTIPSLENTKEHVTYEVYHGTFNTPGLRDYHERLQFFLLFFIERINFIDSSDPIWELLIIFERKESSKGVKYSIIGYATLYRFYAHPFLWRLRLSQILILPPYQRASHGSQLYQYLYDFARKYEEPIMEVTIEDPAPGLQLLRDVVDVTNCKRLGFFQPQKQKRSFDDVNCQWTMEIVQKIQKELLLSVSQIRRCYEILKLMQVDQRVTNQRVSFFGEYHKEVKRRLYKDNLDSICARSHSLTERKKILDKLYLELEQHYLHVIRKARLK